MTATTKVPFPSGTLIRMGMPSDVIEFLRRVAERSGVDSNGQSSEADEVLERLSSGAHGTHVGADFLEYATGTVTSTFNDALPMGSASEHMDSLFAAGTNSTCATLAQPKGT